MKYIQSGGTAREERQEDDRGFLLTGVGDVCLIGVLERSQHLLPKLLAPAHGHDVVSETPSSHYRQKESACSQRAEHRGQPTCEEQTAGSGKEKQTGRSAVERKQGAAAHGITMRQHQVGQLRQPAPPASF